jgi:two-component system phosphate regulon sensor histidine kinase PhoR
VRAGTITSMILGLSITAAVTAASVFASWAWRLEPAPLPARWWVIASIAAIACVVLLVPIGILLDRSLISLRKSIEAGTPASGGVSTIMSGRLRMFRPITRAFIGAVDQFQQREQALRNQLGDLEIRHRVSEAERRQIEAVLHALRDGVLVTDAFNEIVMANQSAASILGFDLKSAIHKPIDAVIKDQRLRQLIRDARETGSINDSRHEEHAIGEDQKFAARDQGSGIRDQGSGGRVAGPRSVLPHPSPSSRSTLTTEARVYDITLAGVANHKGEVAGVVTILHDLTREREVSQMKSDFVSKASHELRTPLSSIRGYVEMLVDGEAGDEASRREFYRVIHSETERLGRLIDNMLNISRIEAGIVQIERENVDMKALIQRAVATIEPQAREKGLALGVRMPPDAVDLSVEGDSDMLYQVVLNLLSNAVKYGQGSGISDKGSGIRDQGADPISLIPDPCAGRITVTADTDNLTRSVLVSVSDTGLGIPPDALPKLFDKFFRVENYKRVAKGTGLGLSLCKHIVETVHHGQIGVDSKLGMGSRFWFNVPMRYAGAARAAA